MIDLVIIVFTVIGIIFFGEKYPDYEGVSGCIGLMILTALGIYRKRLFLKFQSNNIKIIMIINWIVFILSFIGLILFLTIWDGPIG